MFEIVLVSDRKLVGEIIRLEDDRAYIQVYENTAKLRVDDPVYRTGHPLSVELGPGLLNNIYDGIQRPLEVIKSTTGTNFIPVGVTANALDREKLYKWKPSDHLTIGAMINAGDVIGVMEENTLIAEHRILVPPNIHGKVIKITPEGSYNIEETLITYEADGEVRTLKAYHKWPVRLPRPHIEKLTGDKLLQTGQRVIDAIFPTVQGGTCAIPGAFGCGKTCVSQAVSKYSNCDIVTYVGCGERGNEMAEILSEFPELMTLHNGKEVSVMLRTILIANTSNMPVAAREASIYTGMTISEYFRDMGYSVVLLADSTSRWAEALREISGRLSEMPADNGYPAYLGGRLAEFYERAGRVSCIGSPERTGSVSVIGAVSPPGGDFSDPVTVSTMSIVQVFWALEKKLAQRKHFPSINWLRSYSNYLPVLKQFFANYSEHFTNDRNVICDLLQKESSLLEIVQLVGRESLGEDQKLTLETAKIIRQDFLQQNAFSDYDYYCPLAKTAGMMRAIVLFYETVLALLKDSCGKESTLTFSSILNSSKDIFNALSQMKFMDPRLNSAEYAERFKAINNSIINEFKNYTT